MSNKSHLSKAGSVSVCSAILAALVGCGGTQARAQSTPPQPAPDSSQLDPDPMAPARPTPPSPGELCGGVVGIQCGEGLKCVDDPDDNCDPVRGGRDCAGICRTPATPTPDHPTTGTHGEACGAVTCPTGQVCCNASCGMCTPPGGACTQQFCQ